MPLIITATTNTVISRPGKLRSRAVVIALATMVAIAAIAVLFFLGNQTDCLMCGGPVGSQVAVTAVSLRAADFLTTNAGTFFTCGVAVGSFLMLSNTGTAGNFSVTTAKIDWKGQTTSYSLMAGGTCVVGAAGSARETQNLLFAPTTNLLTSATAGGNFTGYVALANGAVLIFAGTFQ